MDGESLLNRTLRNIRTAWSGVSDSTRYYFTGTPRPDLPEDDLQRIRSQMIECLKARGGEVSARGRAAELGRTYLSLNEEGRSRFLNLLANEFAVQHDKVDAAVDAFKSAEDEAARRKAERDLRTALVPQWRHLMRWFTALPDGVKFLVDLRAELLPLARSSPELGDLDADLRDLLSAWFDVGLLEMRSITWDAPAALLEKLIAYEAVHAIQSWDDLKNRLDSDRRCFAFFHPNMPDEPLIFVEVALVNGMSGNVQTLLDESAPRINPEEADTAIFYSISNAQRGLAGISFGNFLIKRVVDELRSEFPKLKTFATLSPIPGFGKWLRGKLEASEAPIPTPAESKALQAHAEGEGSALLQNALAIEGWWQNETLCEALQVPVSRAAAHYLFNEKGRGERALDPVAHFHLSNGARMERLNWLGDVSGKGVHQSYGMMINYLYKLPEIDENHESYSESRKIAVSSAIKTLARG